MPPKPCGEALEDRGIAVTGEPVGTPPVPQRGCGSDAGGRPPEPIAGVRVGAPRVCRRLLEDLRITDKVSQNLHAELALRAVGRARRNIGSFEAGLEEMKTFLDRDRHRSGGLHLPRRLRPGAPEPGDARQRGESAAATCTNRRSADNWISLLPVGGQDGTLRLRFGECACAGTRLRARPGSLSHVSALSGYVQRIEWRLGRVFDPGEQLQLPQTADIRGVMDRICNLILE